MGTMAICFVVALVLGFFYPFRSKLFGNLFIFEIMSLLLGFIISINLGNYISGEPVLTETRALQPIGVGMGSREIFLIKKDPSYYYFTMGKRYRCTLEINSTIDVNFEDGVREERKYTRIFKNKKLNWMFFKQPGYIKIVVSSKEDIL